MSIEAISRFFWKNMGVRQTIFKNTFWLAFAEIVVQLLKLGLIVYAARVLGAEAYGRFSFALSFVVLFVVFAEFGLPDIITREFSQNPASEKEYPSIISLKIFLSAGVFLLMWASSFFVTQEADIRRSIWFLGIFILITSFLNVFYAFFRARQKMEYEAIFKIAQYGIVTGFSLLVLWIVPSIENLSLAYCAANAIIFAMVLAFFHFFIQRFYLNYHIHLWKKFIHFSWPLILGFSIGWIYVPISSVMLGYFGYHMENGWYNAAYKIVGALAISAVLISKSFFPVLSNFSKQPKEKIQKIWNYQKEIMMMCAFPLAAGSVALAPKIIGFFYDASFAPAVQVFSWLSIVFAIDLLYYPYVSALIVFGREKIGFIFIVIGLVVNSVLGLVLMQKYALGGVVAANIMGSAIVFFLAVVAVMRRTPISPVNSKLLKTLGAVIFSSAAMYAIITFSPIYALSLPVVIIIGVAVYSSILVVCYCLLYQSVYYRVKGNFHSIFS